MIATKTTALMLALGMLGIAGMMFVSPSAYAQSNTAVANNEDNDVVVQSNEAKIEQKQSVKCDAEAEGSIAVNVASNDCDRNDQDQDATVLQSNDNDDNDVQVANAEAEQSVCGQLAFLGLQVCGNED